MAGNSGRGVGETTVRGDDDGALGRRPRTGVAQRVTVGITAQHCAGDQAGHCVREARAGHRDRHGVLRDDCHADRDVE